MRAEEMVIKGNLSVGDIIESKIVTALPNGTLLELPLFHKAVVVNPETLQIVQYRYKDQKDTTAEERHEMAALKGQMAAEGSNDVVNNLLDSVVEEAKRNFRNADGLAAIRNVRINCYGPIENGMMDLMRKYKTGNRKVYLDNLVESFREPCRINNNLDICLAPLQPKEIARRALVRIGEEQFDLQHQNCETFANWVRYGANYSEQGERIGKVLKNGINGFEALCERANRALVNIVEGEIERVKNEVIGGGFKGAGAGIVLGGLGCLMAPPACPAIAAVAIVGTAGANAFWNFRDARDQAMGNVESEMKAKLEQYKPEFVRIVRDLVVGLKLEKIVKINV
uniref:LRAT domain-containing protein n=1 Tax=Globodera pallida TaxID=36090 RepID=A0A183C9S5_GLOPA